MSAKVRRQPEAVRNIRKKQLYKAEDPKLENACFSETRPLEIRLVECSPKAHSSQHGLEKSNTKAQTTTSFEACHTLPLSPSRIVDTRAINAAEFQLPSSYQPSRADLVQEHYIALFISSFFAPQSCRTKFDIWIHELPVLVSSSPKTAVMYSIRAATMAFYGKMVDNKSIQVNACQWYAKGLQKQRQETETQLQLGSRQVDSEGPTESAICASIMLSLFESVMCTSFEGWAQHLIAAGKMLEMRGPENCVSGRILSVFRTIRLGAVYISMAREKPSPFASEVWCTIPFSLHTKTPFDRLLDVLFLLPEALARRTRMRNSKNKCEAAAEVARQELEREALLLDSQLDEYWEQNRRGIDAGYDHQWLFDLGVHDLESVQTLPSLFEFQDSFAALVLSIYDAARVTTYSLLMSVFPTSNMYVQKGLVHAASILAVVAYHEFHGLISGGSVSMVFPLKVVCVETSSKQQRVAAQDALRRWSNNRGSDGICQYAAPFAAPAYLGYGPGVIQSLESAPIAGKYIT